MKPRVLVVDDSLTVRMNLQETFETAGFETAVCGTVADADKMLARQTFSLIILDVLLPDGDGVEVLRQIKANVATATIPVLLLSTEAEVRDRVRGLKTGADEYIGKPYDANWLLTRARELMQSAGHSPESIPATLLLIDDSVTFREQFKNVLEEAGYRVATATSGEEGVRAAAALRPHAIIVDRVMPGPIDGAGVIRRLKQDAALRQIPCLLLTGSDGPGGELRALESGADAYLNKSMEMDLILARVTALLRHEIAVPGEITGFGTLLSLKKILTVDDSPTYLHEVSAELRKDGYDVIAAASGREALELLETQPVDCILLDLVMPGLSGKETCRTIKRKPDWWNIPLLILTSMDESQAMVESINAGADDYIRKSSDFEVLKARVRAQLRRKQLEDEYRCIQQKLLKKEFETMQARAAQEVAEARAALVGELEEKNQELEAFSYSVSHDLRAPLRAIDGFSQVLLRDFAGELPAKARDYLGRVHAAAGRMSKLIEAILQFSRISRTEFHPGLVDLSQLSREIAGELVQLDPERQVEWINADGLAAEADMQLVRVVLANLLENAWKFTAPRNPARIEVGGFRKDGELVYFVRDNGVGFSMAFSDRLFAPFQRLHPATEFPGTGIGLATVDRIIRRHGGRVWAESAVDQGTTIFFTLAGRDGKLTV